MFLINKYTQWYFEIIEQAKQRKVNGYSEKHHIVPRSLGGSNVRENFVVLTAREHFVCHLLLTKMVEGVAKSKMQWAFFMMTRGNKNQTNRHSPSSRIFEMARKAGSESASFSQKGKPKPESAKEKMKLAWIARRERKAQGLEARAPMTEQARENIRQAKLGKKLSEEHKTHIKHGGLARWVRHKGQQCV